MNALQFKVEDYIEAFGLNKSPPSPDYVLLVFNKDIYGVLKSLSNSSDSGEKTTETKLKRNFFDIVVNSIKLRVFLSGDGAPIVGHSLEILIKRGAKFIIGLGYTASLNSEVLKIGNFFTPSSIIRTDGVSKKYVDPSVPLVTRRNLLNNVVDCIGKHNHTVVGVGCSTDSYFRHNKNEIDDYVEHGALSLDMESGAFTAITKHYKVSSILINIVSEEIFHGNWKPNYPRARDKIKFVYNELQNIISYIKE
ncbi:MAG: hypothetical protein LBI55_00545 [Oscillospiraceae bacterium]|jgi:uridine phosphorylase|nr:hypothetical protein [Oscillospiraceae bacterium]